MTYLLGVRTLRARTARWVRAAGYLAAAGAGGLQLHALSRVMQDQVGSAWGYLWAALLLVGGALAAAGAIGDLWAPELAGVPMIALAVLAYSASLALAARRTETSLALALLLLAVALWLLSRTVLVLDAARLAQRAEELRRDDER